MSSLMVMINTFFWLCFHLVAIQTCNELKTSQELFQPVMALPPELHECSGMVSLGNNLLLAHNDSGNKPWLYIFNMDGKPGVRTVVVKNVKNYDWEELASDDEFIYIGDTGNNGGTRQNLMIYKVRKDDVMNKTEVTPEIISFRYAGQTRFTNSNRHNFDCEAFISKGDSLYLFTKNRGDFRTDVYALPKVPGEYVISTSESFDTDGLVTGADYRGDEESGALVLVGYNIHGKAFYPFIYHFPEVRDGRFFNNEVDTIRYFKVLQTETIIFEDDNSVLVTNEEENQSEGLLYKVSLKKSVK